MLAISQWPDEAMSWLEQSGPRLLINRELMIALLSSLDDDSNFYIRCYRIYWLDIVNFVFLNLLDEIGESDVGRVSEHSRYERESL